MATKDGINMTDFDKMYAGWTVTKEEAKQIGDRLGIDWKRFPLEEFRKGIEVEFEHQTDILQSARIALDHLKESESYYSDLEAMEKKEKEASLNENQKILLAYLRKDG